MSKTPVISGRQMVKILKRAGFVVVSQKGSHIKLSKKFADQIKTVIVPNHKEIRRGTLGNILKLAELNSDDLK